MTVDQLIAMKRQGAVLILTPHADLGESHWLDLEAEAGEIVHMLDDPSIRYVVLDLKDADYFGSEALAWFLRIRSQLRPRGGRLLLCHLSPHGKEILQVTGLEEILDVHATPAEALSAAGADRAHP